MSGGKFLGINRDEKRCSV